MCREVSFRALLHLPWQHRWKNAFSLTPPSDPSLTYPFVFAIAGNLDTPIHLSRYKKVT